jgi:O-antigen ligase
MLGRVPECQGLMKRFERVGASAFWHLVTPILFGAFVALPWLNPFAPGPTSALVPLLFSWACVAGLLCVRAAPFGPPEDGYVPRAIAWAWLLAGVLSCVIGLCQYFGYASSLTSWMSASEPGQAFANLRQRNHFATLTNIALLALLWLLKSGHCTGRISWAMGAAALLAAGNAAASSRTGLLQLGLLCVLYGVWGGWRLAVVRRLLLAALGGYGVATLALPWLAGLSFMRSGMLSRFQAGDSACASRLALWDNVLQLIAQRPWVGWGWGELDYAHYMTLYPGERFCALLDNAHNLPLHLAVELGIPFALVVCGMAGWLVWRARPWRESHPSRQLAWGVLGLIGLHSLLEYPLWYGPFQMAAGLCVYLLWLSRPRPAALDRVARPVHGSATHRYVLFVVAACVLAAVAYTAWDYHRVRQIYLAPDQRDAAYRQNTLERAAETRLFRQQLDFAALSLTPLTPANAQWTFDTALSLLHFSPEPRVIEKVIESAVMLRRDDEAMMHLVRYRAAFPANHAQWRQRLFFAEEVAR